MNPFRIPLGAALVASIAAPAAIAAEPLSLFNGEDLSGWTNAGGGEPSSGWVAEDGCLVRKGGGGDLFSAAEYGDFDFRFEWKVAEGANSGVKYRMTRYGGRLLGPEYQVLDDEKHPDGKNGADRQAAALYDILPANEEKKLRPVGEWNEGRIVARGTKFEHWLNGACVVSVDTASDGWADLVGASKFAKVDGFATAPRGRIMLQDHGDQVWFRHLTITELDGAAGEEGEKGEAAGEGDGGWASMFDGKTLEGWKVSTENPDSFSVDGGTIKAFGPRAHLFFGEDGNAKFKDFEFECEVKTTAGSNAGIFFHTAYQEAGWPDVGYEAQVNATHSDWRKTASVYSFQDVREAPHRDDEWFTYNIKVEGKKVTITIDGEVANEYTEPEDHGEKTKRLGEGTIGLQAHDPKSLVFFRNLRIRSLD